GRSLPLTPLAVDVAPKPPYPRLLGVLFQALIQVRQSLVPAVQPEQGQSPARVQDCVQGPKLPEAVQVEQGGKPVAGLLGVRHLAAVQDAQPALQLPPSCRPQLLSEGFCVPNGHPAALPTPAGQALAVAAEDEGGVNPAGVLEGERFLPGAGVPQFH